MKGRKKMAEEKVRERKTEKKREAHDYSEHEWVKNLLFKRSWCIECGSQTEALKNGHSEWIHPMEMCHEGNSINILIKAARTQESFEAVGTALNKCLQLKKEQRAAQLLWHQLNLKALWLFLFS